MSDQPIRKRRRLGYLGMMGLCLVLGLVVGTLAALIDAVGGAATDALQTGLIIVCTVIVAGICIVWWRDADEAVREAHKWAWYWGGSAGMALVLIVLGLASWEVIDLAPTNFQGDPADLIMTGVGLTLGAQFVGYLIAWAAWWLRHR
ncbi:hypothetical protein [Brevundimonas sp.]|uniref:hypothetical protein n=1 Tax=Brevundimonas sp. TaxID=1871086 RepID=UPI003AF6D862